MGTQEFDEAYHAKQIAEGNRSSFKKIFLNHYEALCNFCWRYTKSTAIAEDLVQETFADLWRLRDSLDPNGSLRIYLYQSVKNKALDYLDHQKIVRQYQKDQDLKERNITKPQEPLQDNKKFINEARIAIDNLPRRAQQVYVLHREDGLTYREIAEVMEISVKTVESQMSRALGILRSELRDKFPDQVTERTIAKIFSIRPTGTE